MAGILASVITAVITGAITLAGVLISNNAKQAVLEEKITALTREVREHNNFARRMPVLEERIDAINHRLDGIEKGSAA